MEPKATFLTSIFMSFPVTLENKSTIRAFLAGKPWIHINHVFSQGFSFIVYKLLKLPKCPIPEHSVEPTSTPFLLFDREFFEGNHIDRLMGYPLTHAMVRIGHKTFLPTNEFFEFSFGRPSSFGLKYAAIVLVSCLNCSDMLAIVELIVRQNCVIANTCVYSENRTTVPDIFGWGLCFGTHPYDDLSAIERNQCGIDIPIEVLSEILRNMNWDFHPPPNTAERGNRLLSVETKGSLIVPDCAVGLLNRQFLAFFALKHFRCTIPRSGGERSRESIFLPDLVICKMMKLDFVMDLILEACSKNVVCGLIEHSDCFNKPVLGFGIQGYYSSHDDATLILKLYMNMNWGEVSENTQPGRSLTKTGLFGGL